MVIRCFLFILCGWNLLIFVMWVVFFVFLLFVRVRSGFGIMILMRWLCRWVVVICLVLLSCIWVVGIILIISGSIIWWWCKSCVRCIWICKLRCLWWWKLSIFLKLVKSLCGKCWLNCKWWVWVLCWVVVLRFLLIGCGSRLLRIKWRLKNGCKFIVRFMNWGCGWMWWCFMGILKCWKSVLIICIVFVSCKIRWVVFMFLFYWFFSCLVICWFKILVRLSIWWVLMICVILWWFVFILIIFYILRVIGWWLVWSWCRCCLIGVCWILMVLFRKSILFMWWV